MKTFDIKIPKLKPIQSKYIKVNNKPDHNLQIIIGGVIKIEGTVFDTSAVELNIYTLETHLGEIKHDLKNKRLVLNIKDMDISGTIELYTEDYDLKAIYKLTFHETKVEENVVFGLLHDGYKL